MYSGPLRDPLQPFIQISYKINHCKFAQIWAQKISKIALARRKNLLTMSIKAWRGRGKKLPDNAIPSGEGLCFLEQAYFFSYEFILFKVEMKM